ncbi:hypothetical protein SZ39_5973 [Bacillus mycoides]|nr:hypothetical protein SZ39_5973 [Bacillus mycoides]
MKNLYSGNGLLIILTITLMITCIIFMYNPLVFSNFITF